MKTVILPTDYSDNANNAINYALQLFKNKKVNFVLYHAYIIPNAGNTSLLAIDDVIRKESLERLKEQKATIQKGHPNITIETVVEHTTVASGIERLIKEKKADIVVMGTQGATGLKQVFLGSNAVDVIDEVSVPVWVIPEGLKFKKLNTILFSSDYERIKVGETLNYLKEVALTHKSKLKVLHIKTDKDAPPQETHLDVSHEEAEFLKEINPEYRVVLANDAEKGINWYLKKHPEINVLSVINHKRSFFEGLFKKNTVHDLAYHCKLPLLVLKEA
jgi:nucleotide-binding universal stress UspA family protein